MDSKQVTESIAWFIEDSKLTRVHEYSAVTNRASGQFETVIFGVPAESAKAALADYFEGHPRATTRIRKTDGYLVVIQPAN